MEKINLMSKSILGVSLFLSALMICSCAGTWVQRAPELQTRKNVRVLVGHYNVTSNTGADIFDLSKQAAGGISFADVSMETYTMMTESLKKFNMTLVTNKNRAKRLDRNKALTMGNTDIDDLIGSIASTWTHPETASKSFHRIMAGTTLRKQVTDTLKGKDKNEVFLSADLKIEDQDQYLVFKRFRLILSIQILDQKGEAVFQAKTEGFSNLSFLRNPISEQRIQKAMAKALANLEKAPVKNEISTITNL